MTDPRAELLQWQRDRNLSNAQLAQVLAVSVKSVEKKRSGQRPVNERDLRLLRWFALLDEVC